MAARKGKQACQRPRGSDVNENIIAINIPNAFSIVIMAALGAVLAVAIRKLLTKSGGVVTQSTGANTTLYNMAA